MRHLISSFSSKIFTRVIIMAPIWDWNCLELDILATKSYTCIMCIELLILIDSGIYIYSEVKYHYISYVVTRRQAMEIEKQRGNFSKRLSLNNVTFADLVNPWNFYSVFFQDKTTVHQWMFDRGLLRDNVRCHHCDVSCSLQKREIGGYTTIYNSCPAALVARRHQNNKRATRRLSKVN